MIYIVWVIGMKWCYINDANPMLNLNIDLRSLDIADIFSIYEELWQISGYIVNIIALHTFYVFCWVACEKYGFLLGILLGIPCALIGSLLKRRMNLKRAKLYQLSTVKEVSSTILKKVKRT